jgi:hypothetical protein
MEMIERMAFAPDPGEGLLRRVESYTSWISIGNRNVIKHDMRRPPHMKAATQLRSEKCPLRPEKHGAERPLQNLAVLREAGFVEAARFVGGQSSASRETEGYNFLQIHFAELNSRQ